MNIENRVAKVSPSAHFIGTLHNSGKITLLKCFDLDRKRKDTDHTLEIVDFDPDNPISRIDFDTLGKLEDRAIYLTIIEVDCSKLTDPKKQISDKLVYYEYFHKDKQGQIHRIRECVNISL